MLFTTATKSYRKHYSLSFLPTSYSPLQNFATTDVCHNTYCCLSLCFPKKRIMSFREHHGKQASDFWLSEVTIYAILLLFLFLRETLNWEQGIVSKQSAIVRALLGIKLKRLNYRNSFGILCSTDDQLHEGVEI